MTLSDGEKAKRRIAALDDFQQMISPVLYRPVSWKSHERRALVVVKMGDLETLIKADESRTPVDVYPSQDVAFVLDNDGTHGLPIGWLISWRADMATPPITAGIREEISIPISLCQQGVHGYLLNPYLLAEVEPSKVERITDRWVYWVSTMGLLGAVFIRNEPYKNRDRMFEAMRTSETDKLVCMLLYAILPVRMCTCGNGKDVSGPVGICGKCRGSGYISWEFFVAVQVLWEKAMTAGAHDLRKTLGVIRGCLS